MIGEPYPAASAVSALSPAARLLRAGLAVALSAALGSIALQQAGPLLPGCLFHELTGVSCLTCGLTRSLEVASHGHILAAFRFHLLGPFLLAGMLLACVGSAAGALTGRCMSRFLSRVGQRHAVLGIAALWIVYGVVRALVEVL